MITIKDVAQRAGVPEKTAMRALAGKIMGKRRDAKDCLERVLKAASELGYHPSEIAKSLRKGKTATIGLVVGSITNRYFSALVETVMDEAERHGYRMILELTRWDAERSRQCLDHLQRLRVDGVFFAAGQFPDERSFLDRVHHLDMPTMMLYRNDSDIPAVCRDHSAALTKAVAYLVGRQCRNIVLAAWDAGAVHNRILAEAFHAACKSAGAIPKVVPVRGIREMDALASVPADAVICDAPYCLKYYCAKPDSDPRKPVIGIYDRWNWVEHPENLAGVILLDAEEQIRLAVRKLIAGIERRPDEFPDSRASEFVPRERFSMIPLADLALPHLLPY